MTKDARVSALPDRDLVVFGGDFARHPSSLEHLVRRLAKTRRVIWVETLGMRRPTPSLYDLRRVGQLARRRLGPSAAVRGTLPDNLSVIAPFVVPFNEVSALRQWNDRRVAGAVRREMARRGIEAPVVLTSLPITAGIIPLLGAAAVSYYCPDDWAAWPGLPQDLTRRSEARLLDLADQVVVTSEELRKAKSRPGREAKLLPHGVDVDHFAQAGSGAASHSIQKAAYFGLFDARTDQELLFELAKEQADLEIRIIGPVQVDVTHLKSMPNVKFEGPLPYAELPSALREIDLLLLPYRLDELAKSINPLKVREYLATGKAVVAMGLPEVRQYDDVLCVADTPGEFLRLVRGLRSGALTYDWRRGPDRVRGESWDVRAAELNELLRALAPKT